ncbi:MAG: hypothetical protein CL908_00900 [Deltaproteobacteria bacterium]|nr:hypothetical protein [Deltaproteobacteria bacterium]
MKQPVQDRSRSTLSQAASSRAPTHRTSGGGFAHSFSTRSDEAALIDRLRQGDREAFGDIYAAYRANVHHFIRGRVASESEADDLTQDTFVQAICSIHRFEGRSSLLTWLLGIARHVCLRFYRFADRWMIGSGSSPSDREQGFDSQIELRVDAVRALDRCDTALAVRRGPENQSIFHRRYAEGQSIRSIAAQVGKTSDAVKANLRRSRVAIEQEGPQYEELTA